ncbi:MAG: acetoacetate--CoA ligase [Rhodocyclales bacterium RIFCSPLOWO2_02_FULL_63_24]|nr:MAG: acetoacetate--CoA ligase [Rhodocyclales bacterium RIFCSPLOWO2_02_FULL_63_24]
MTIATKPIWQPSPQRVAGTRLSAFMVAAGKRWNRRLASADYSLLHAWSIEHPEEFWTSVWEFGEVRGEMGTTVVVDREKMPGAKWFPEARLNFAENLLRRRDASDALVFWGEDKVRGRASHAELYRAVAQTAAALRAMGVAKGDRVAAYLPNLPATVVAMLATASIGAIFSSASPDFGVQGVLDRFGQIEPKVLFACDGYWYNGKVIVCIDKVVEIAARMPSLERVVVVPYAGNAAGSDDDIAAVTRGVSLADFLAPFAAEREIRFEQLPFDHPLYIMYSSGTTGVPKCIVHCAGGALLQHLKEHQLQADVKPGDRLFYFTTCGWMMWNWLVSGLASGATLLLYDGSPFVGRGSILFDYADAEGMTHFGTSAKFIDAIAKIDLQPRRTHKLAPLRAMFSTGSPLVAEGFDYVYANIKQDIQLASISGGTDIISCFVLGNPNGPVYRGEIQCAGLGMAVDVFDDEGRPLRGEKGELVCTRSFPVMPIGFWKDEGGAKYRAAYFERFDNIWCHGDFAERTANDSFIIYGRSDATLNPGGVRIGTAEIYRQVEKLGEVVESLVIGQDWPPGNSGDVRVVLFVKLREGMLLDDALATRIKQVIRDNTTPRHVPAKILQVGDIPRTKSGKIVELAVRNVVHGEAVKNVEALANPEALDGFRHRAELSD